MRKWKDWDNPVFSLTQNIQNEKTMQPSNAEHYENVTMTRLNRVHMYPRCLLFNSCDSELQLQAKKYFEVIKDYACMHHHHSTCDYEKPLSERLQNHPLINTTITKELFIQSLAHLPPTSPRDFLNLQSRINFKTLYLVQGGYYSELPKWYLADMKDIIFLSYKLQHAGQFYYPKSSFYCSFKF